ncbi:hypothetical protein B0I32_11226 [Nonomuraea fuscirosea]|uniref:Uncharacterized protein n=1 Tax=Nonomuraea fuscirosea TaxID=1291556 RepID=A0A2T0MUN7_9ACTN|nr:hypothetical protein [Nonomuraea fuscirosea]PRX62533.1 hypothetical protein B0I32_11226 [Nonomuraea fuscirosea]
MTPQSDEDEVWRQIVASFNDTAERDSADQPWPDSENVPAEPIRRVVKPPEHADGDDASGRDPEDDPSGRDHDEDEEDEGHFEPPPPPPLPKVDLATKLAWVALFGGPAYLLVAAMASWHMEGWALFTAVAAFIGGFVALVVRMGDGPPNDSGWDDGAVL